MRALQRLVVTGHWAAFIWLVLTLGLQLYLAENGEIHGDEWLEFVGVYLPIVAFALVGWIFTGKFILWPWNRSLPKQED